MVVRNSDENQILRLKLVVLFYSTEHYYTLLLGEIEMTQL